MTTKSEKRKLIATNAAIWTAGILASFILPMVTDSMTEGRSAFLRMIAHTFPLFCAMLVSTSVISKAVGEQPQ